MTVERGAVHPTVARTKFEREVANLSRDAALYRGRGAFLLAVDYPTVLVGFASPKVKPAPLIFAMHVDYTDYDLQAPSVRFVDPFTGVPYTAADIPTRMVRTVGAPQAVQMPFAPPMPGLPPGAPGGMPAAGPPPGAPFGGFMLVEQQPLLQDYGPDDIPFLCLPGVREYHAHPGHSGDPWELHRTTGAGSLVRLVNVVLQYAVEPLVGWNVQFAPQVSLGYGEPPQ